MEFEVIWKVEDGYIGHGPQTLHVDLDEFDSSQSLDDIELTLSDLIQNDFENTVSWVSENYISIARDIYEALQAERSDEDAED